MLPSSELRAAGTYKLYLFAKKKCTLSISSMQKQRVLHGGENKMFELQEQYLMHERAHPTREISFSPLKHKIHIFKLTRNFLFRYGRKII